MANLIQKFTKTKPSPTILASLTTHLAPKPTPSLSSRRTNLETSNLESTLTETLISREKPESSRSLQIIFPNFPYRFYLSPISPPLGVFIAEEVGPAEDARAVWADSTKKKRKKKMNKHKYKKLRKHLRRKARA